MPYTPAPSSHRPNEFALQTRKKVMASHQIPTQCVGCSPTFPSNGSPVCGRKRCATPGCEKEDWHDGPHTLDEGDCNRLRRQKTGVPSPERTHIPKGYDSLSKRGQRFMVVQTVLQYKNGTLLYLDGPDAGFTLFCLEQGMSKSQLHPVNNSRVACESIEELSGVTCKCGNILAIAASTKERFDAVWFDMTGGNFETYELGDLVACAHHKFWTLSSRGEIVEAKKGALLGNLYQCKEIVELQSIYRGCSDKFTNMIFVATKSSNSVVAPKDATNASKTRLTPGTVVRMPLDYWKESNKGVYSFVDDYDYKVYDGQYLIGSVHSLCSNSSTHVRLTFNTTRADEPSILCSLKYPHARLAAYVM